MIEIMYYLLAVQDSGEVADGAISKSCCPGYNRTNLRLLLSSTSHFGICKYMAHVIFFWQLIQFWFQAYHFHNKHNAEL